MARRGARGGANRIAFVIALLTVLFFGAIICSVVSYNIPTMNITNDQPLDELQYELPLA